MEGLLSFLLVGGLFFLMMRFGCGAHMMHGSHGHTERSQTVEPDDQADPVCGMSVDPSTGYSKMHDRQLYRFCSRACLDKFEEEPSRYITTM